MGELIGVNMSLIFKQLIERHAEDDDDDGDAEEVAAFELDDDGDDDDHGISMVKLLNEDGDARLDDNDEERARWRS